MSLESLRRLRDTQGQSLWLDNLSRTLLEEGQLARYIEDYGIRGITSNPSIFEKAIRESRYYREDIHRLKHELDDVEAIYEQLVVRDIQAACDLLRPIFEISGGDDGYVSWEESPKLAHNPVSSVVAAERLRGLTGRANLLIKIPATEEGIHAFEELVARGHSLNITLMFSLGHVRAVFDAYIRGLRRLQQAGGDLSVVKCVASLFLSRVDTLVDARLTAIGSEGALALRGQAALAMARLAYRYYQSLFHGPAFADLANAGARPQYLLWASTGTKNAAYSDLLYVENLIGPETINTLPDGTLKAFADHGRVTRSVDQGIEEAEAVYRALGELGIDMDGEIAQSLQEEGLKLFSDAFDALLARIAQT
ncbi:MAG: transaldolase [Halothiobacillaceae bacterium]|nr:transaldolase [Halothiobacillaceae bacterium]